jgi:hypothetical protein
MMSTGVDCLTSDHYGWKTAERNWPLKDCEPMLQAVHFIVRLVIAADTALFSHLTAAVVDNSLTAFPL